MTDRSGGSGARDALGRWLPADSRGVAPVVGKALEAGLVVAYVSLLTSALFGGVVPDYRTAAGDAVADRTVAAAAQRVQQAVPPDATAVRATARVAIPDAIRGTAYEVVVRNRTLVVVHPHPGVAARARLALPAAVASVDGRWDSTERALVSVRSAPGGLAVRLHSEGSS